MKSSFVTLAALGLVAGAAAQQPSQQPVPTPDGRDRTNQVSFDKTDANKDGVVNREEGNMIAGFDFSRADTNHDLTLSRAEFDAAMARTTSRGDGSPGPRSGDRTAQVSFESVDSNKDGKLDQNEAMGVPGFNFSSADVDDNRSVSRQEFQTAMANARPRG
jgi:EF hand domain-containing protein